tara:strand:+ start:450 stop:1679 length:1230 start_codon:yes stop_codon:yes gene_type:complete
MKKFKNSYLFFLAYNLSFIITYSFTYNLDGSFKVNFLTLGVSQLELLFYLNVNVLALYLLISYLYKFKLNIFRDITIFVSHTFFVITFFWIIKFVNLSRIFIFFEIAIFFILITLFNRSVEKNLDEKFFTFDKDLSLSNKNYIYSNLSQFPSEFIEQISSLMKDDQVRGLILTKKDIDSLSFTQLIDISNFFGFDIYQLETDKLKTLHRSDSLNKLIKNIEDVILLTFLGPLSVLIITVTSILVLLIDGLPIFYKQDRVGLNGRYFKIYKFRTMKDIDIDKSELEKLNERSKVVFKAKNDPRITKFGNFLRKSSLDELPQIINVLKNEMSFIGPRPPIIDEVKQYELKHLKRISVKPGITGLWQVSLRQDNDFDRWVAKDIEYIENWSLWLDIKIILKTVKEVIGMTGE